MLNILDYGAQSPFAPSTAGLDRREGLLPYAELIENDIQDVFDVHHARDLAHGPRSVPQLFRAQNDVFKRCTYTQSVG